MRRPVAAIVLCLVATISWTGTVDAASKRLPKITQLSVAPLIGEAIKRIHRGESVGALFSSEVSFTQEMLLWDDNADDGANGGTGDDDTEPSRPALATALPSAPR